MTTVGATKRDHRAFLRGAALGALVLVAGACSENVPTVRGEGLFACDIDSDLLVQSLSPNAIPALTLPPMVDPDDPSVGYLSGSDRVLGIVVDGEARAYPHNIFWYHEIVNDQIGNQWVSVTFCPLTGSGLGFDPTLDDRRLDLGVSGLLFANNLVMYDRLTEEVYGPQLSVVGSCQGFTGSALDLAPVQEMSWDRWKELHPDTKVLSGDLGMGRDYTVYPYGSYDDIDSDDLLVPMAVDRSRPLKERVLAIRSGMAGVGYPFGELRELGEVVALNETVAGVPTAIFFEARDGQTALAFDARVDGQTLTFEAQSDGTWMDLETGSTWTINGEAIDGTLAGARLETRADAYTLFWFAWRHFQPDGQTFSAE